MAARRALIVDDSKTAQIRLRKLLEQYGLIVDTAFSAEEALGYLSYKLPTVIFLDHHMQGMDGLAALKIIKSNPRTALVPVVMYTSEKGDVYVSQARALGALDIVSKEINAPSSIEKVLNSLSIGVPEDKTVVRSIGTGEPAVVSVDSPEYARRNAAGRSPGRSTAAKSAVDLEKFQDQLSRLFEKHLAKVRHEVLESNKFVLKRLADISRRTAFGGEREASEGNAGGSPSTLDKAPAAGHSSSILSIIACIALALLGYFLWQGQQNQQALLQQYGELMAANRQQQDLMNALAMNSTSAEAEAGALINARVLLDGLSWTLDLDTEVPFGERPWSEARIGLVDDLLHLLDAANFQGTVFLTAHAGDFCYVITSSGKRVLADAASSVTACTRNSAAADDVALSGQVSVAFSNYLNAAPILLGGGINVEFISRGYEQPMAGYPEPDEGITAGAWNAIAQKNNRVGFYFQPD